MEFLTNKRVVLLDGDGTLYTGDTLIPGASAFLETCLNRGLQVYLLTNNSSKTPALYQEKLAKMGLGIPLDQIIISTHPAIAYFKEKGISRVYGLANKPVTAWLGNEGLDLSHPDPEALLLTYDTQLSYDRLAQFCHFVQEGRPFYATHPDICCPSEQGPLPDVGSFLALIKSATGQDPRHIFGKPNRDMLNGIRVPDSEIVMIGDRLYTDIQMTLGTQITSVLTLSGETTAELLQASDIVPDYVLSSLASA